MSTRWARFARGWVAALFATLIAAASHTLAGGGTPNLVSLALALAFSVLVCVALTGRSLSLLRTGLAVGASQVGFHLLFATLGGATGTVLSSGGHNHAGSMVFDVASSPVHHTSVWMYLAHAFAAIATIVVLRRGEAAFWGMRATLARFLVTILAGITRVPILVPRPARIELSVRAPRLFLFLTGSLQHRGPPALA
ncbi:hypothetical protein EYE40_06500 [Glaciihabitans arcticus]|uniref:Uncharacterized protein n=1 Tax=Glaciihabitans arcticus TaxID=2668039 RepID=A0A4V2JEV3_9MICO|nr:hypothetical protein [Glaciihabitans arcticus]TBN57079.1 hypothetical protein EYE40_06500 [Glaciihabitans arcticus]